MGSVDKSVVRSGGKTSLSAMIGVVNGCTRPRWHSTDEACNPHSHQCCAIEAWNIHSQSLPMKRESGLLPLAYIRVITRPHSRPQQLFDLFSRSCPYLQYCCYNRTPLLYICVFVSTSYKPLMMLDSMLKGLVFSNKFCVMFCYR